MIGQSIGRYRIVAKLGEGGMGSVWRAEDTLLHRPVALKFLPDSLAASPEARQRFLREARAASQLDHSGIATVYDAGEADGRVYIAMLLVEGETVAQRLKRGPLLMAEAVRIAKAAAEALAHALAKGVLHRDVSSGNLMVTREGRVVVVDFGLALPEGATRLTQSQTVMGTAAYLAPEVAEGKPGDRRSDLYGLGVVLYEMLTGVLPFVGERRDALLYRIVHEPPPAPSALRSAIPEKLDRIVLTLLAKDPGERYADATELATALTAVGTPEALARLDKREEEQALSPWLRLRARLDLGLRSVRRTAVALATFRRGARLRATALVLVLVAGASAGVLWQLHLGPFAPPVAAIASVAVLPLANKSQDPEASAHLADGINEELVTKLGKLAGLRVIPWATSQRYGDPALKLTEVAKELHVDALIVGTFRKEGDRLSATLALVSGRDGFQRWADQFEQPASDLFTVQREIALAVAAQIKGVLSSSEETALVTPPGQSVEAYEFYLQGAEALQNDDKTSVGLALSLFDRAVSIDPRLADAYVGVGAVMTGRYYRGDGGQRSLAEAETNFRQALSLNPDLGSAQRGLIRVNWENGKPEECLKIAKAAIERAPQNIDALETQGEAYCLSGLADRAIPVFERILAFDPANQSALWFLMLSQAWGSRPKEALASAESYLRRFGEDAETCNWIADCQERIGDLRGARASWEKSIAISGDDPGWYEFFQLGRLCRRLGQAGLERRYWLKARKIQERVVDAYPDNTRQRCSYAFICAALSDLKMFRKEEARVISDLRAYGHSNEEAGELVYAHLNLGEIETATELAKWLHSMGDCNWPTDRETRQWEFGAAMSTQRLLAWNRSVGNCLADLHARY